MNAPSKPVPPGTPPPSPPPGGPTHPIPTGPPPGRVADDRISAEAERIRADLQSPARQDDPIAVAASDSTSTPGGPAQTPVIAEGPRRPAVAGAAAVTVSGRDGRAAAPGGARPGGGRAGGAPGAATFTLPPTPPVPSFD